jgi:hypothetical protein
MARFSLLLALVASASALRGIAAPSLSSKLAASRVAPSQIAMSEPSEKATVIGAAAVGGIVGVYLFHELSAGLACATILSYGATTASKFGEVAKTAGSTASKAYSKGLELNEQYDVLPKAKSAVDTVVVAADNLNENYGITKQIDEKLKVSEKLSLAASKVDGLKSSVTDKLDDIKSKASS